MKKLLFLLAISACFILGAVLETPEVRYQELRAAANEDGGDLEACIDLDGNGGAFSNMASGAVDIFSGKGRTNANAVELIFAGGDAANDSFSFMVMAWRHGGPATVVCYGTATLGSQDVVTYPDGSSGTGKFWADTLSVTDEWPTSVGAENSDDKGSVAKLCFDLMGYRYVYVYVWGADGSTGTEAGNVSVWYAWY